MTSERNARGGQRRDSLVAAGVAQLAEHGWAGVTQRAVAGRAGANPGLVHYYFHGSTGLRRAVAEATCGRLIGAMFDQLAGAADEDEIFTTILGALEAARADPQQARLVTEIVAAAFDDPEIGRLVRAEFARARTGLAEWFGRRHPDWDSRRARAAATLLIAAMDGLTIHALLDPALPTQDVAEILRILAQRTNTLNQR
jgi:AcrR family transcriptional regulator